MSLPETTPWDQLTRPFSRHVVRWGIVRISDDSKQAEVRPYLDYAALVSRFDEVLTPSGWSVTFEPLSPVALVCTLSVEKVHKSLVMDLPQLPTKSPKASMSAVPAARCSQFLFAQTAELFGLRPDIATGETYWVDYDAEAGYILHEPHVSEILAAPTPELHLPTPHETESPPKSPGQQAIDRLIERLKHEGLGAEVAKVVIQHGGGYGQDAESSRALYAQLRALLLKQTTLSEQV